jgi:NADH:ubiquinone oxidoreductase subunit B-like Fe-S oxidoreductase
MSMVSGGDPFEALGAGPPAVSARAADLLIVAGSITRRGASLLQAIHERMLEPRWVVAWGACAISGGGYQNYATVHGLCRLLPVDVVVPGCPPPVAALREVLEHLRSGRARRRRHALLESRHPSEWPILREATEGELVDHPAVSGLAAGQRPESERNQDVDLG